MFINAFLFKVLTDTTRTDIDDDDGFTNDGLSSGAIVGIVLGTLAMVCLVLLTGMFFYRRNKYESVLEGRKTNGNLVGFPHNVVIQNEKNEKLNTMNGIDNNLYQIGDHNL